MRIGVPTEIKANENRIGMTPAGVSALEQDGHTLYVQRDGGLGSGISNADFEDAGATRDLIGPHHLAQFVRPYHEQLLAVVRREAPGVFSIEHNCSDRPYFEEMLESDVDAVSFAYVDERSIQSQHGWDCHAAHTRTNVCRERFCLRPPAEKSAIARIGNVDHTQIILNAKPDEVFREARACIENAGSSPFVLSTGCEIPFKAPIENIRALARAAQAGY